MDKVVWVLVGVLAEEVCEECVVVDHQGWVYSKDFFRLCCGGRFLRGVEKQRSKCGKVVRRVREVKYPSI